MAKTKLWHQTRFRDQTLELTLQYPWKARVNWEETFQPDNSDSAKEVRTHKSVQMVSEDSLLFRWTKACSTLELTIWAEQTTSDRMVSSEEGPDLPDRQVWLANSILVLETWTVD